MRFCNETDPLESLDEAEAKPSLLLPSEIEAIVDATSFGVVWNREPLIRLEAELETRELIDFLMLFSGAEEDFPGIARWWWLLGFIVRLPTTKGFCMEVHWITIQFISIQRQRKQVHHVLLIYLDDSRVSDQCSSILHVIQSKRTYPDV